MATFNGTSGADVIDGTSGDDQIFGGDGADTLRGGDGADTIVGHQNVFESLRDTLDGGAGNDTLYGEAADSIQGGSGRDLLYIVNDNPLTIVLSEAGIEWVSSAFGNDLIDGTSQTVGIEVYSDGGNDTIAGSPFDDIIWSGSGDDALAGGNGNDVLVADVGVDTLNGGAGNDILYFDSSDVVDGESGFDAGYITAGSGMLLSMALSNLEWAADFANGNDTFEGGTATWNIDVYAAGGTDTVTGGSGSDFLWGGAGNDTITGNAGNDTLVGEGGADTLRGGAGTDNLYGNSGNGGDGAVDTFTFVDNWGTDFVFDFENGTDKFDVSTVTGLNGFSDVTVTNTPAGHAYIHFGVQLIAVANAAGQIDATDFIF